MRATIYAYKTGGRLVKIENAFVIKRKNFFWLIDVSFNALAFLYALFLSIWAIKVLGVADYSIRFEGDLISLPSGSFTLLFIGTLVFLCLQIITRTLFRYIERNYKERLV